jgi:hypothetical protein
VLSEGTGRYQDERLWARRLQRPREFLAAADAVQRGDLEAAVASGFPLQKLVEFQYLRTFIESQRDPIMRNLAPAEIRWASLAATDDEARHRLDEIMGRGSMTLNRSVGVASRVRQAGEFVAPGGTLQTARLTDPSVERLLRDHPPSVLRQVHAAEQRWARRVGVRLPTQEESERSVETPRGRLNRLTLWAHRVFTEDVYVSFGGYDEYLARMQRLVEEILNEDPDLPGRVPRLWTP